MADIEKYCEHILAALKQMGEDTARCEYVIGGLRCYPSHHSRCNCTGVPRTRTFNLERWEEPFWDGLACRLKANGIRAVTEERYPGSDERCDLVLRPTSDVTIWIEGKLLMERWTWNQNTGYYWQDGRQKPGEWEKALPEIGGKDHRKLASLGRMHATHLGLLVLAFGQPEGTFEQPWFLRQLPQHVVQEWESFHPSADGITWPDHRSEASERGFQDRLWLWYRDIIAHPISPGQGVEVACQIENYFRFSGDPRNHDFSLLSVVENTATRIKIKFMESEKGIGTLEGFSDDAVTYIGRYGYPEPERLRTFELRKSLIAGKTRFDGSWRNNNKWGKSGTFGFVVE